MKKIDISVVIPVYGCVESLQELYDRLNKTLNSITNYYEIIFVDDCCPQDSWNEIEKICSKDKKVIGFQLSRNFGQMKAILAGLDYTKGDYVIVMDCDLQDRPEEIERLYNKIKEGYDVVFARRSIRSDNKSKIYVSNKFYKLYSLITGQKYDPALCNFSICKCDVIKNYCKIREEHRAYVFYLKWMGYKHTSIDVKHDKRKYGKSSYNLHKRLKYGMDILFSQSDVLLKIIMFFGLSISILSILVIFIIILLHMFGNLKVGWPSIIVSIFFMGGINMLVIGIVGIYVGNIFVQVKNRPLYFIRTKLNYKGGTDDDKI